MVHRTGTLESPSNVVSITPIHPDKADTSNVFEALGAAATHINQQLQPAREQLATSQALRDFQAGRENLRTVLGHEDELYNNAMLQQYLLRSEGDIEQHAQQLESDATTGSDPHAFAEAWNAAKSAYLQNAAPDFAPHLGALYDRLGVEAQTRIGERGRNAAVQGLQASTEARLDQVEANLSGFSDLASPAFTAAWDNYEHQGQMIIANPLNGVTAEEWSFRRNHMLGRLQGNVIVANALHFYEENGSNADAAAQAYQQIDAASNNPALTLTDADRNSIFADGRRQIGLLESERRQRESEARSALSAARGEARMDLGIEFQQAQAQAHELVVIDPATMENLGRMVDLVHSPSVSRMYYELHTANDARHALQGLNAIQMQSQLTQWRTAAQGGDGDAAIKLQEGLRYTQAISNPRNFVDRGQAHFGAPPPAVMSDDGQTINDMRPRIAWTESHAGAMGVRSPDYFSDAEAAQLRVAVSQGGMPALTVAMRIVQSAQAAGGSGAQRFARADAMMRQIAPGREAAPFMAVGRALLRGVPTNVALSMANAVALRAVPNAQVHQPPNLPVQDSPARILQSTFGSLYSTYQTPGMADSLAQIQTAADLIWENNARAHPHDTDSAGNFRNTYEVAVQEALGANYHNVGDRTVLFGGIGMVNNRQTVLPTWFARSTADSTFRSLTREDFITAGGAVPTTGNIDRWHDAVLVPTSDGRPGVYFLQAPDGGTYKREWNGAEVNYIFDLNRLRPRLAQRPEIATRP